MAVGNPYVPVTITGYDSVPPTDDGAQTAGNTVEWAKHKTKLGDPVKTGVDSTQTAITAALDQRVMNSVSGKTGNYTVVLTDRGKSINFTGSSASTFTLPVAADAKVGFELIVRNAGTNVLTIDGNASETIDGLLTVDLYPGQKIWLSCDGTNWLTTVAALKPGVLAKTFSDTPYAVLVDDDGRVIDVDASGGAVTVNLPAAATAKNGFSITVKKTDSSTNAITIDGDASETIDGDTTVLLGGQFNATSLVCDGAEWFVTGRSSSLQEFAEQAATSGTSIDFTGIPSGVQRITIMFDAISTNGTSIPMVQLGDSGGFEATGYVGGAIDIDAGPTSHVLNTGFELRDTWNNTVITHGALTLTLMDSATNKWIAVGQVNNSNAASGAGGNVSGTKSLSGTLTQIRLTTVNGIDAFDAGAVNILTG